MFFKEKSRYGIKRKNRKSKKYKKSFSKEKKIITEFNPELKLDLSKLIFNNDITDNQNNYWCSKL